MTRLRLPAAQIRPGDQFVVPAELFARGREHRSGGVKLTVLEVEADGPGHVVLHTDRAPLCYRLDEQMYITRNEEGQ